MKDLHLQCQHCADLQKMKRVVCYFHIGRKPGLAAFQGINTIRSDQTEKLADLPSEQLANSDFSCKKLFPMAVNLSQDFWLSEFSG